VLWGDPGKAPHLILTEGIETATAVALAHHAEIQAGELTVAAALSTAGIRSFQPWPATRRITVAADRDEARSLDDRGYRAGETAARSFALGHHDRVEVRIALPGEPGEDEAALAAPDCPHWLIGLAAGFAGTIAALTGLDTCGVNLSGISSSGKTLAQKLAASVWGSPRIGVGLLQSMRTTENALESLAQASSGTVLAMVDRTKLEAALAAARTMLADLGQKRDRAAAELGRLERNKQPMILPAVTEGQGKQRNLDKINQRLAEQGLRIADLDTAIEQAGRQVAAIEHEIAHASDLDRAEQLAERLSELLGADGEIDRLMAELAAAFRKRMAVITAAERLMDRATLARLGFDELRGDFGWSSKTKGPTTRAARAAGLEAFLDLPWVGKSAPLSAAAYPHLERLILALRNGGQREAA
jgi:Domain of unknown function (DUF927)/Toprim domain